MTWVPRRDPIERIQFVANTLKPRTLPATVYKGFLLQLVLTTTNTGGAALTALDLASAINRISLLINGQDNLLAFPGYHAYIQNFYDFSIEPRAVIDTAVGTGKTQKLSLYLPQSLTRAASPADTILDLRAPGVTSGRLDVLWGSASIGTNVTITDGYLLVNGWQYEQVEPKSIKARHEWTHIQEDLGATGNVDVKLEYGGYNEYRRLFIYTKNAAGTLANDQIDNIKVKQLSFSWVDIVAEMLQDDNCRQYSVTPMDGVFIVEFPTDGRMSERLNARNLSELVLKLNSLVSNGTVEIVSEKVIGA